MNKLHKQKYNVQRSKAKKRNIEWEFTYEEWLEWWGDDIINRGRGKGQLCMSRYNDIGPYNPSNVRKLTIEGNSSEGHKGKPKTTTIGLNSIMRTCPHCNRTFNIGNASRWHLDKCKQKPTKE